jgi:hypothetical protein
MKSIKIFYAALFALLATASRVDATDYSRLSLEEILPEILELYEKQRTESEQLNAEFVKKIRPASTDGNFTLEQMTDQKKFDDQEIPQLKKWAEIEERTHLKVMQLMDRLPVDEEYIALITKETRQARLLNLAKLASHEITYGGYARNMKEAMDEGLVRSEALQAQAKIKTKPYSILDEPGYYGPGYTGSPTAQTSNSQHTEEKGFFSSLGDALLNRLATGGSGRRTWMFDGGSSTSSSTCRSIRELSGQVYTFQGPCPVGYAPAY